MTISTIKICTCCQREFEQVHKKQSKCTTCKREYDRIYHANRSAGAIDRKMQLKAERSRRIRQTIYDYVRAHPCVVCGEDDPVVLEFDHIDQTEKSYTISDMIRCGFSTERIFDEISKCRVLCANCHRRHTATQMGWYKDLN